MSAPPRGPSGDLRIDLQLNQATLPWPDLRDRAVAAERAGYSAVWVFDHLGGKSLGGDSMLEAFTLLGALAASTSTIELGVMVANVNNRTPATMAVAASTVQAIAGRRFHLGLGAGGSPESRWSAEMRAVGQAVAPTLTGRHDLVERTLDTIDLLWADDRPAAVATFPLPRPRPTVILGASGLELAALAGRRADGINVDWLHPQRDNLLAAASEAVGARHPFVRTVWMRWDEALLDPDHPTRAELAASSIRRVVLVVPAAVSTAALARPVSAGSR
ncbi:MAG: LLM class flavin-dependent oxidoreductase [Actinomycetota bacterium]|nr:LLM class flavin-dependent oxidoreductase [Actinomycetota bacterium]